MRAAPALLLAATCCLLLAGCGNSHRQVYFPVEEAPTAVDGPWVTRALYIRKTPRELVLQVRVENTGDAPLLLLGGARGFRMQIAGQTLVPDVLERTSWTLWGGTVPREEDKIRGGDLIVDGKTARDFELRWTFATQLPGDDLPWILSAPVRAADGRELLLALAYPAAVPVPLPRSPGAGPSR